MTTCLAGRHIPRPSLVLSGAKEGLGMRLHGRMHVSVPEQQVWEWNHELFLICCF